jgi:hypothetical protein
MVVAPTAVSVATAAPEASKPEGPLWACDIHRQTPKDLVIYKRREDRKWGKIQVSTGPGSPPGPGRYNALLGKDNFSAHVCAFVGADHAWVVGYGSRVQVYRTTNGGQTWKVATIDDPDDPEKCCLPSVELRFRDALHGKLVTVQGGGMGNMGVERLRTFTTSDGGRTWRFKGASCRQYGKPYDCDR